MTVLDSWRGLCACAVVLFHLNTTGTLTNLPLFRNGWLFVDFFFILSGFVITASYRRRLAEGFPIGMFMLLRLGRVYPLYLVVLLVFVVMECMPLIPGLTQLTHRQPFTAGHTIPELIGNLLLLQSFTLYPTLTWNGPSWSIAAEVWTYLFAAMAMKLGRRSFALVLLLTVVASGTFLVSKPPYLDRTFDLGFVRCLLGFGLGSAAWLVFEDMRVPDASTRFFTVVELTVVACVLALVSAAGSGALTLACPLLFVLVVWIFAIGKGAVSRLLHRRPIVAVGRISYSIYIIHIAVVARMIDVLAVLSRRIGIPIASTSGEGAMKTLSGPSWISDLATLLILSVTIAIASITYRYVEMPCRDWTKRLASRYHARRAEALVPAM